MLRNKRKMAVGLFVSFALAFAPGSAEARFGKRSGGGGGSGAAAHGASPVYGGSRSYFYAPTYRYYLPYYNGFPSFYYGWGYGYYPYYGYYPPYYYDPYAYPYAPEVSVGQQYRPQLKVRLGAEAQASSAFGTIGVHAGVEGHHFGIDARYTHVSAPPEDPYATPGTILDPKGNDAIRLFNLFGTYALVTHPRARLRVEAGLMSAFAPDLQVVGPGGGFSGMFRIVGPLEAEASIHGTPYPYYELDWNAGLSLQFGPLVLRGGWRRIFLNDNGLVTRGVDHKDTFSGPFAGVAFLL